jgi:hypothetical protein
MSGKFALIVANTEYADTGLAKLSAPGKDAEDLARVLKDQNICAFDDVRIVLNQPEHIVRRAIEVYFSERKPSDLVVFYFSGHGIRDELGALYLAVKNTARSRLRSTAIKSDYVREIMDQSRSKRQVLILDCCNSGAFVQGTKSGVGGSMGTSTAFGSTGSGLIILTASDSTQFAWEGDQVIGETQNSLFTHFLVKGLEGEADEDGDGTITIDELYDYAYEQIVSRTPKQTPRKWSFKQQGEIVLRQSIKAEDIGPAPLPKELVAALENMLPYVREGAVKQLGDLLKSKNVGVARSARATLEEIANEDDSRYVASAAKKVLESADHIQDVHVQRDETILGTQAQERVEHLPGKKIEEDRISPKKAAAMQAAQQSEIQKKSTLPIAPPKSVKAPERIRKRSITVWTIMFLGGITLLVYATLNLLGPAPSVLPEPTTPPTLIEPTLVATSSLSNTAVPTSPPTAAPLIFTVVVTSEPTATPSIPSDPAEFVSFYFENVNNRKYDLTWSLLSDAYKARTNPDGKEQYVTFWSGYNSVIITSLNSTYVTNTSVQVNLEATFYKDGTTSTSKITYFLSYDNARESWLFDIVPNIMCNSSTKRLSVGSSAQVATSSAPLLLRRTPARGASEIEKLFPDTIVSVINGPTCNAYGSVYFWWWEVRSPSGKTGWIVEGSDPDDPIFIQPVP